MTNLRTRRLALAGSIAVATTAFAAPAHADEPVAEPAATTEPQAAKPEASFEHPAQCLTGRVICIDKTSRELDWLVDGIVQLSLDARFGSTNTPTREGVFKVDRKAEKHTSSLYGGPMPFSLFFSGGQAIHYSYDFAKRGYAGASYGCVNTRDMPTTEKLFRSAQLGDSVFVYKSSNPPKAEVPPPAPAPAAQEPSPWE